MPFVVRIPKRSDFCGCPPCPLCFDWLDDIPAKKPEVKDGLTKMAEDVTGKPIAKVTKEELAVVKTVAESIHERNKLGIEPPEVQPKDGATFNATEDMRWFNASITEKRKVKEREKKHQEELNKPKTLDRLADEGKFAEKAPGALSETEKIAVEVRPGTVVEMTPQEYERYKDRIMNNV